MPEEQKKVLPSSLDRAVMAANVASENRGRDIVVLDLRKLSPLFDFFVIATGNSRRQLRAMSDEIDRLFQKQLGDRRYGIEGYQESLWVLLDYGDILIHLFEEEKRDFYALEELWGKAERIDWQQSPHPIPQ